MGLVNRTLLDILIAKRCCGQGYKAALRLKNYLESKKYQCCIYGKKWQNLTRILNEHGVTFNEKENQAWIIVKELGICIKEKEVDNWIIRDKTNG